MKWNIQPPQVVVVDEMPDPRENNLRDKIQLLLQTLCYKCTKCFTGQVPTKPIEERKKPYNIYITKEMEKVMKK